MYQLLRVEAEIYKPGDTINGASSASWHNGSGEGLCLWISETGDMKDAATIARDRIVLHKPVIFLRLAAIGLEYDGVTDGELDFLFTLKPAPEIMGDAMRHITAIATANSVEQNGMRTVVFVAVLDLNNGMCTFKGVLPLDGMLDCAIVI